MIHNVKKHFKKHVKRHHVNLGWITLAVSAGVILISAMWSLGIIDLPSPIVFYSRQISKVVAENPRPDVELPVKFYRQEHSLSCEAAVLRMVLNFHGVDVSESEVIQKMPFDETSRSGDVWGNPHLGFVGNIDGKMMQDGYGVYWEPLSLTASNWMGVQIIKNGTVEVLVKNISEGKPVIVWGYIGRGKPVSWQTSDGTKISGIDGEHTRIVYGYKGSAENPDGFMVMDPSTGPSYWEKSKFLHNWDAFGRMGIVVYP